jgi:hypothetical protein
MQIVDRPIHFPGCCMITGDTEVPMIDFMRQDAYGNHLYMSVDYAKELAALLGGVTPENAAELREQVIWAQDVAEKHATLLDLYTDLQTAVERTLRQGVVEDRGHNLKLRPKPGRRAPDLETPISQQLAEVSP